MATFLFVVVLVVLLAYLVRVYRRWKIKRTVDAALNFRTPAHEKLIQDMVYARMNLSPEDYAKYEKVIFDLAKGNQNKPEA